MNRTMSLLQEYKYILTSLLGLQQKVKQLEDSGGGGTTGDFIPLTGTEEGKPISGNLLFQLEDVDDNDEPIEIFAGLIIDEEGRALELGAGDPVSLSSTSVSSYYDNLELDFSLAGDPGLSLNFSTSGISMYDRVLNKGLYAEDYYGANYDDNTYVQKKYVDKTNSYSTDETETGGTWIDGKPIYTITQLTADPAPTVDIMIKSTVVGGTYTEYEYTKNAD